MTAAHDCPPPQGSKPRLEYHAPENLMVDPRYQRGTESHRSRALIQSILAGWNWNYFGVVLATDNGDGTYCVIDGQHRAEAARQHPAVHSVPVMVIDEMTLAEQAQAFRAINERRVALNALQLHKARVLAGDADAKSIAAICAETGVRIPANVPPHGKLRPGELICIKTLYQIYRLYGPDALRRTLKILMTAYRESAGDMRAQLVLAVCLACLSAQGRDDVIAERLAERDGETWITEARAAEGKNTVANLAQILIAKSGENR